MGVEGVPALCCRALGTVMTGELSSLLLGESMRRGGGRDDTGVWMSLDERGMLGKGEKLPGARPWARPEAEVEGCISLEWRGARYILTEPQRFWCCVRLETAVGPRGQNCLRAVDEAMRGSGGQGEARKMKLEAKMKEEVEASSERLSFAANR